MTKTQNQLKGSLSISLSALFFASYGIWSRLMAGFFGEFNQAWIRGVILVLILTIIGLTSHQFKKITKKDWRWFLLIAFSGGLNQAPYYYAFEKLEIGIATMLFYASLTVGGFIFGKLAFKEKMTPLKIVSLILAMIGMALIYGIKINGGFLPLGMAILAGLMGSAEMVFSKKVSSRYSTIQTIAFIFATMLVANFLISLFLGEPLPVFTLNSAWWGQLGYTLSMLGGMYAGVVGFKHLEASVGSLIGLLEIVFAVLFGLIFFHEILSIGIIVGGGLTLLAAALPDVGEIIKRKRKNYSL